jgi:hypothetical protein
METRRRGLHIPFVPMNFQGQGEKKTRIEDTLEPNLVDGRLFAHPNAAAAHEEGREFPTGFLDVLDCMSACSKLFPKKATTQAKMVEHEREFDLLKRQGVPFSRIMERLAERRAR